VVECLLPKQKVEGSNPFSRSNLILEIFSEKKTGTENTEIIPFSVLHGGNQPMPISLFFLSALNAVKIILAADFACKESDFDNEGVFIHQAKELPGRRRFFFREKPFSVITMGRGVVVSCSVERLGWCDANLSQLSRNEMFAPEAVTMMNDFVKKDGQCIVGPHLKYICTKDIFQPYKPGNDIEVTVSDDPKQIEKYNEARFPNSLTRRNNPELVIAVVKYRGEIAGKAGASADTDTLWQIGVDTLEPYHQKGIGKAMVSALTEYILNQRNIPYYSTLESNAASRQLAASLGYKTAWIELYASENKAEGG
jgi:RimJ/RimL family protein N-acetyltransferase